VGASLPLTFVLVVVLAWHFGSTDSWLEARCTVAGSRVIRADVADSFRAIVQYKGEYQLRYSVRGHDYYVWASSGWADPDREFVQNKIDNLPQGCDFRVRYNPLRPSEAIAVRK
jgi:Protein of unknown function (DUF3592)